MGWFVFVLIIVYLIYRAQSSVSKPQPIPYVAAPAPSTPKNKPFRANFEKEVNDLINGMRCGRCNTGKAPTYNNKNGNETINCCCEPFMKGITDRIEANFSTSRVSCKMTYNPKELNLAAPLTVSAKLASSVTSVEPTYIRSNKEFCPDESYIITYCDYYGDSTQRKISNIRENDNASITAFCHLRNEERTFRLSRIVKMVNCSTGEEIVNINTFFNIDNDIYLPDILAEANDIASKVKTIPQYRALEMRLDKTEKRALEVTTERAIDNANRNYEILQAAIDLLNDRIFNWQFIPSVDLHTPSVVLEHAYKVYSPEEYMKVKSTFLNNKTDWYALYADREIERPDPSIKLLLVFRKIVESSMSQQEKIDEINKLALRKRVFYEDFFSESDLTPGDQWFADALKDEGMPLAHKLYKEGYTTIEKCLEIIPDEFFKRRGVGQQTVKKLIEFQSLMKDRAKS